MFKLWVPIQQIGDVQTQMFQLPPSIPTRFQTKFMNNHTYYIKIQTTPLTKIKELTH